RIGEHAASADGAARADPCLAEQLYAGLDDRVRANLDLRVDQHRLRQIDGYARLHQPSTLPLAEDVVYLGKLRARVTPQNLLRVGHYLCERGFTCLSKQGNRVGQIELVVNVQRTQVAEARPQLFEGEAVHPGVDLVDGLLVVAECRLLHDGSYFAVLSAH